MMMSLSYCYTILNDDNAKSQSLEKARDIYCKLIAKADYQTLSTREER